MKATQAYLAMAISCLLILGVDPAYAVEAEEAAQQEIAQQETTIDELAATPKGEENVSQQIKDQFVVDESVISSLREKKFGYGEIMTTLALADKMEGGINETNIQSIVDLRNSEPKKGWGEIAKQFNISVGELKKGLVQSQQGFKQSDKSSIAQQNIKAALDSSKGGQNEDILPVTKNLPDAPGNRPTSVPKGK